MKKFYFLFFIILFFSCKKEIKLHRSFKNILILGNSITIHVPDASIGWYGNWGMAATSKDKDYVHVLEKLTGVSIQPVNISGWENSPLMFDLSVLDKHLLNNPDLVLIRLGENIRDPKNLYSSLEALLNKIKISNPTAKIMITGTFWLNTHVTAILEDFANQNGLMFVPLSHLARNENISFIGDLIKGEDGLIHPVTNQEIADHPGDAGMQKIAEAIALKIEELNLKSF